MLGAWVLCLAIAACGPATVATPVPPPSNPSATSSAAVAKPSIVLVLTQTAGSEVLSAVALGSGTVQWSTTLPGEAVPLSLGVATRLGKAYVLAGHQGGATLTPVSLATGSVAPPIAVGTLAWTLVLSPDDSKAYVVNAGGGILALPQADGSTVTPVDLRTDQALPPLTVGDGPGGMAFATDTTAYVSRVLAGVVVPVNVLDGHIGPSLTVPSTANRQTTPSAIAVSPNLALLAVGNLQEDLGAPAPVVNMLDLRTKGWERPLPLAGATNAVSEMMFSTRWAASLCSRPILRRRR